MEALRLLAGRGEGRAVVEYLVAAHRQALTQCARIDDPHVQRLAQGAERTLDALLSFIKPTP